MSSIPEKNDDVLLAKEDQENGGVAAAAAAAGGGGGAAVAAADDEMKSLVKKDSDDSMSSSVGFLSDGDGDNYEDGDEAVSTAKLEGSLNSLASLEAALPFKRGLSSAYNGKSKSFMNLADVKSVEEVEKEENPLNKRRRLTITQNTALYKRGSTSSSMPQLTHSDGENAHSDGPEQEFKPPTTSSTFTTKPSID